MASYNKVILMGNLTRDPETRVTPNGATICKIGLAVNRVYNGSDGERKEEVTYVDCDAFGRQAETISRYMSRGKPILIEGRLRLDQWQDRQSGENRSKLGVVIDSFQFVGSRSDGDSDNSGGSNYDNVTPPARQSAPRASTTPRRPTPPPPPQNGGFDDDVPF